MSLFKGYVPTKNKQCLIPFKNKSSSKLWSYEQVKNLQEYAGIIADDVILIDVDDYEQSEILMDIVEDLQCNCRVYETTRGKHFLFKNTDQSGEVIVEKGGTKKTLACGITADIKVGCKNSYSILKIGGKPREIIYDIFDDEEYEIIPKWLFPVNTKIKFLDMEAGDGRNQALFTYILTLQSNDFSVNEARTTLKIINKYVLKNPLTDEELETLSRDDAFKKPTFFKKGQFLYDDFAIYMKNNNHIIKINDQLHIYKNGIYVDGYKEIESQMIKHIQRLNRAKRQEVLSYMEIMDIENLEMSHANYIAFKNGIYNIETDTLEPFTPDIIITNKIEHDYNPDAYSELADKTLDKLACHDKNIRMLLEECIGYCFYRRNELRKSFILTGEKENGKSTFLAMIKALLGRKNIASLDLKELGDRFKTAELFGKLANIGDDIGSEFIPNPAVFKKLSSGNPINVERKGKDPFDFSSYAKLLFSANSIPRIKDKSGAVISRLVIIPFDARFSADDPDFDPYIKYKLIQEEPMQYLINIGVKGLNRVLKNQKFTSSEKTTKALQEYTEYNNPILLFFKEDVKIENEPTSTVYRAYSEFCIENSFTPMSNIEFSKQVKKHFNYEIVNKTIKGKKYRVFVKKGE
ncbi:MAG: phage/plasmid primase, P4 family [Erysipelotrichaceae bacterium]